MATDEPKTPMPFDPAVLIDLQWRNLEAFTKAGQIVADSMRDVAERQVALMQETMSSLWGEMRMLGQAEAQPAQPGEQPFERVRAAFEQATAQVQEMGSMLLRAQAEAMLELDACAAANMAAFGKMAPDLPAMQKAASEAIQAATAQVGTAVEEMRRGMRALEGETRKATGGAAAQRAG
jgi:hypothetical protein